jgi:hypothetical protein
MSMEQRPAAKGHLVPRVVIGVFGNKQHGKDTVASIIVSVSQQAKFRARKFALADPLKRVAMDLLGMPREVAFGSDDNIEERERLRLEWTAYGKNGRQWLQWIGTELGREQIDRDLWLDRAVDTIISDDQGTQVFAISDCRFHNERVKLREKLEGRYIPFLTLRVKRPDQPVDLSHASEAEVASMPDDVFDGVIVNDGDLDKLRAAVMNFLVNLTTLAR